MRSIHRTFGAVAVALLVAACGGAATATSAPPTITATAPVGTAPARTAVAATKAAATPVPELCTDVTEAAPATDIEAAVTDFKWEPVSANVGQVITWTNNDSAPHGVQTDKPGCRMIASMTLGQTRSLVFKEAGTFTFFCFAHTRMRSTITIS